MPKAQSKSSRGEPAEESLEVGAVDDGSVGAAPSGESKDPVNMNDIASMMQICLQFQRDLGEKLEKETIKQDKRWRQLQIQVNNIRDDMKQQRDEGVPSQSATPELPHEDEQPSFSGAETRPGDRGWGQAVVPRLEEEDDIEQYLTTFERLAVAYQWPEMEWAVRLVPHLTGKARAAYVAMAAGDSLDYRSVKEAILAKYAINEDVYRQRFREPDVQPNESPKEFYNRPKDLYHNWIQPAKRNKEEIEEIFILEQFYRCLSPELRVWVREREPKSAKEAAFLVETFLAARRGPKSFRFEPTQKSSAIRGKPSVTGGGGGGPGEAESVRPTEKPSNLNKARTAMPVCFYCGQEGHIKPNCPVRKAKTAYFCTVPRPSQTENKVVGKRQVVTAKINNKVVEALLDTSSVQTLIHPSLLNDRAILGRTVLDICVHGDHKSYPIAVVYLEIAEQTFLMSVGVVDSLAYPVILGQDLPILQELVGNCKPVNTVTRSQKRTQNLTQESETQKGPVSMRQSGVKIYKKDAPDVTNSLSELPFFDVILPEQNVKMRKTRAQKRKEKMLGTIRKNCSYQEPEVPKCDEIDFMQLQHKDTSLQSCFRNAEVEQGRVADRGFFLRDKVLYYKDNQDDYARLVVPQQLPEQVLHLGHSIPWAGHLGTRKTLDRVASRFYWPGLNTDVQNFCQSCSVCQLASDKNVPKYLLQPLPIIDVPFSRIAMDIVGPVERTQSGNRYILVICDYGTRYPEAFPLRDITAKQIAYALLQLFSRVGIPSEILTDQDTNFLSNTLKQVYRLLGIKSIRTTAYHPQTDGLVERYNRTLKSILRKFISMNAKDWDKWLPYLLFAYREVPQASTGFSPFELLYGRQVRGPLDVLQEAWVGAQTKKTSVLEFVLQMREKMEQTTRLVRKQLEKAQHTQQTWYDKSARQRSFNPGQQVLLLLPTAENKLLAKWQGPYTVLRKLSPTTYEIEMPERRDPKQTFHINLLKEWKTRDMPSQQQLFVRTVEEEDEYDFTPSNENFASLDLSHLSLKQQEELQAIIPEGLFQEKPGATDLVEHNIHLKNANPIRQKMYRIPQRLVPILEEEITVMKELKNPSRTVAVYKDAIWTPWSTCYFPALDG
ncbi:uncharacterized protein LOC112138883 isoform X2 [Oryzias melastigma]|uniref:uncharacterized protein LOC112138883 isoform X2 n=1 Tax=Oryzias melastigma TaxID=30732 RepID=UPI00168CC043|nr:uncharacterized protein LOC112138883 isoform X2 [Oryzias melastigma]